MYTIMVKWQDGQTLQVVGDFSKREIRTMEREGWRVRQRDKQQNKNGIAVEG